MNHELQLLQNFFVAHGELVVGLAVAGAPALGVYALLSLILRVRARDLRHLGAAAEEEPLLLALRPLLERLAFVAGLLPQQGHRRWAQRMLRRANLTRQWSPELLEAVKLAAALATALGGLGLGLVLLGRPPWTILFLAATGAYFWPDLMVYSQANTRQDQIRKSLPFVTDLIAVSAEAGLAFQQAIRNVVENGREGGEGGEVELLREFEQVLAGVKLGKTMGDSLQEASDRLLVDEFALFVNAIRQAERLGTPVAEALKSQSRELRTRLAARVEAKANQAPVKILFPLMIFIFPVTGWVIVGPILLRVFFGEG